MVKLHSNSSRLGKSGKKCHLCNSLKTIHREGIWIEQILVSSVLGREMRRDMALYT